jgi:hypothetical protein
MYRLSLASSDVSNVCADMQSLGFQSYISPARAIRVVHTIVRTVALTFGVRARGPPLGRGDLPPFIAAPHDYLLLRCPGRNPPPPRKRKRNLQSGRGPEVVLRVGDGHERCMERRLGEGGFVTRSPWGPAGQGPQEGGRHRCHVPQLLPLRRAGRSGRFVLHSGLLLSVCPAARPVLITPLTSDALSRSSR